MANKVKTFIETFTPKVKKIAKSKGITDPNIIRLIVQQAGYESNYGTSRLALNNNNYWGITNGGLKNGFKKFKSTEDGISYLIDLLNNDNYRNAFNNKDFINSLSGNPILDSKAFSNWINYKDDTHNAYEHEGKYQRDFHLMKTFFNEYNNYNANQNIKENNKPPLKNVEEFEYPMKFISDFNTNKFETGGLTSVDIPSIVIQSKGRRLPNPNTPKGRKQSKFYTARILNGDMDISAVPKEYRASISNYLKSQSIEQAARDRKGYEGLNELMYVATGGFPALLGDVASKSARWLTDKAFDIAGTSEDSKARKYTKLATQIASGLYAGGKTAWNDIGALREVISSNFRPNIKTVIPRISTIKNKDIYDTVYDITKVVESNDLNKYGIHPNQLRDIKDGNFNKRLYDIKRGLTFFNYNNKSNIKLHPSSIELLLNATDDQFDNFLHTSLKQSLNNSKTSNDDRVLKYASILHDKLKKSYVDSNLRKFDESDIVSSNPNNYRNLRSIISQSPKYTDLALYELLFESDEKEIIKSLIQAKHTFVRGARLKDDLTPEDILLKLNNGGDGGRNNQLRDLGTLYTSNSISTAGTYATVSKEGVPVIGFIRKRDFDFSGDVSTWWKKNELFPSYKDVDKDYKGITVDKPDIYKDIDFEKYLNDNDVKNIKSIISQSKYKPKEFLSILKGLLDDSKYGHYIFEGIPNMKLDDYYIDELYIGDDIMKLRGLNGHNKYSIGLSLGRKFGGMIPARHRFDYGGISAPGYTSYGSVAKASDVDPSLTSADGEGIIGNDVATWAATGLGAGASIGIGTALATGAAAGSWAGPIGAAVGLLIGGTIGLFTGRSKKRKAERQRAEAIAQQQEAGRQAIIGNMESKEESDVAQLRQNAMNTSEATSFYTKFGGMIPHRKLFRNGGQIIQNSSNTAMAYGPSHENGGIAYSENAEIEGGEAIRQTPIGDQIYSDKLFIPGTRRTFADGAQVLSEIKGMKEQEVQSRGSRILGKLEQLDRTRVNKLKMGTLMRNIEKDAFHMDKSAGQVVVLDKKLNDLFNTQEAVALVKGLRGNPQIARMGGCIRKKYPYGGIDMSEFLMNTPMVYKPVMGTNNVNTTGAINTKAFNNLNLAGLGINVLGTSLGMISNALSARTAQKSLDWQMRNLTPAKRAKLIAPRYSTDYNINSDLQDIATQERRVAQYIKSNTSNPILARNLITKAAIDNLALRNKLYSQKRDYQTQRWDANINARIQTDNQNRQNDYLDQIDLRNHNMQYLGAIGNVQMQRDANFNAYLGDLVTAGHQYLSAKAYSTLWPTGVQRTMNTGLRCGGLIKGRRK